MLGGQPPLDVDEFDVARNFFAPLRDEISADDVFGVEDGALDFGTKRFRPEVLFEVLLC